MRKAIAQVSTPESIPVSHRQKHLKSFIFSCGDCLFLILVGVMSTLVMHLVHRQSWHLVFTLLAGMTAAMVIQTLLALAVAPILGSIESMVSSMLVAMPTPMMVCVFDMVGIKVSVMEILALGVGGGLIGFALIALYGCRCRKTLCCRIQEM